MENQLTDTDQIFDNDISNDIRYRTGLEILK
jgi:hypothetical protein